MNRFLTGNEWNWRLARTIVQGILGVFVAHVDVLVGAVVLDPSARAIVVAAGRILGAICEHDQYGVGHQGSVSNVSGSAVATLFNRVCGIGYELLRYAYPETMLSVL